MCLILTDKHEPSSTRLINMPVKYGEKKYKLLIYTNDLKFNGNSALMVVPIPKRKGDIGLVDVSTNKMKKFRKILITECEKLKPNRMKTRSYGGGLLVLNGNEIKTIFEIGNYNISVANNINELLENIDWTKFDKPLDFEDRISVMKNKEIFPEEEYFYVVAKANKSVSNDGFGVVYPDCGYDYFPTAHEKMGEVNFDVKMYNLFEKRRDFILYDNVYLRNYHLDNILAFSDMFKYLETEMTMVSNGGKGNFEVNMRPNCNYFEMREIYNNGNLILDKTENMIKIQKINYREELNFEDEDEVEDNVNPIESFFGSNYASY